jgi:hypothetical protein
LAVTITPADERTTNLAIPLGFMDLKFADGAMLPLNVAELSPEIIGMAILHGLKQKLVDAAAISRDPTNGRAASVEIKRAAVMEVYDRLLAGEWNKRREGGGANAGGLLFRALCEMYAGRKSAEDIKAFLEGKSDKEKAALRKNPKVAEIIDRLRASEGGESSDELLNELEG